MIVGSLLLILVAVTLLVLGLVAGSSTLLTSSIVASLLAAVALVVGARHAAATRAASTGQARNPLAVDLDDDPGPTEATTSAGAGSIFGTGRRARAEAGHTGEQHGDDRSEDGYSSVAVADRDTGRSAGGQSAGDGHDADDTHAGGWTARAGWDADTDPGLSRSADSDEQIDADSQVDPDPRMNADHRIDPDARIDADRRIDADHRDGADGRDADPADPAQAGRDDVQAGLAGDDLDEDPADEPLPQRVQPTDAVRVSRMTVDVHVVDGRPRYHLDDCSHLQGRESEPLPVAEAVDLGFTPCGRCRPVDRLVAAAARG